ncbi:hypothetical protein Ancab_032171 [Ancistrocladus abbreviatus]
MGLWTLLQGFLLFANALAILNEDRFLARRGWSFADVSGGRRKSLKEQVVGLIYAAQYMRLPLIVLNIITIVVKLVSGVDSCCPGDEKFVVGSQNRECNQLRLCRMRHSVC